MSVLDVKKSFASVLVAALSAAALPAHAAPAAATLSGTVIAAAATPLANVLVVVKDSSGARIASATTATDGSFSVGVAPGVRTLGVETPEGAFDVATPITLAPGETRGVHLAVRQESAEEKKKKKGGAYASPGATAAMIVTIVGFAVMAGLAIDSMGDDDSNTLPASPSNPE